MAQVRNNTESTTRQYGLAGMAASLGWAAVDIEVIDADLGLSGRSAEGRAGFEEVVGRVCLGEVGAIFGLEVSRLARSSADLSKLLELARLTDTLVVDADGVYDLSDINDRLLLGLKNQMSEAELHLLASRMDKAKRAAAARGDDAHVAVQRARYGGRRARLCPALQAAGWRVTHSEAGPYLWASHPCYDGWESVAVLARLGILVAPGVFYGEAGRDHVRVALTATDDRVGAAVERLALL